MASKGARRRPLTVDRVSDLSTADPWSGQLWMSTLRRRTVGILVLAVAAAAVPAMGPDRFRIALALLIIGVVYQGLLKKAYEQTGRIPVVMPYLDVALCLCFPLISIEAFVPSLLVLVTIVALAATTLGTKHAFGATALAGVGMGLVAWSTMPPDALVGTVGMVIASSMAAGTVGAVTSNELRVRRRFGSLIEELDGIVWEGDPASFGFTYVSPQAEDILGYPIDDWHEERFWETHLHPDDRERAVNFCLAAEAEGRDHEIEYRMIAADGRVVHLHDVVAVTLDKDGRPRSTHGVMLDITDRKRTEERVLQYADIVETIGLGLVVLHLDDRDDDGSLRLMAANPAACAAMNRPLDEWTGRLVHEVLPIVEEWGVLHRFADVAREGISFQLDEIVMRPGQVNEQVLSMRAFPLPGDSVGVSLDDVTNAAVASKALRRQALHDGLTGLPNRTLLKDRLGQALAHAGRTGDKVALLVMDLDQFKEINDALGHHVGDLLLSELSHRLRRLLRSADVIARLGGDEFAVLMTTDVTEDGAVAMAERIKAALLEPFELDDVRLQTNASVGIAVFPDDGSTADELTQRADVAMYQAKRSGTGYALYKAELDRSSVRRLTLLGEMKQALEAREFLLHYQPIIDVGRGRPVRAEALVRWMHPGQGLIGPDDFIELAEVSGFIQPLTHWILEEAIASAATWWKAGHRVGIAVNLSVRNLYDPHLPGHVRDVLAHHGLPPGQLMLEVTESELMDDPGLAMEVLGEVHRSGVATGVDDFGTGYSSLTYLRNLPIREIKIDRSFVSGMTASADDLTIVRSTIDLGHNLSLDVVAEGVEDALTLLRLGTLGCDLAQGFHLSPPLPLDEFTTWLAEHDRDMGPPARPPAPGSTHPTAHPSGPTVPTS